jgi:hypothetical protein
MTTLSAISLTTPAMVMGMILIALPIAAHLMNRRTRRRVVFPSIQLLASVSASQSSLFRLRRWWLLLLRCLAVMAVVLAFAQPVWLDASAQSPDGRGEALVILIDRSASTAQQYAGVSATHWISVNAQRVLASLEPGVDSANIVYATAHPYAVLPTLTTNTDVLRAELESIEPTYERADLAGAMALAGKMLAEHQGGRRLVILTDLQASNWTDTLKRLSQLTTIPKGTSVTILPPNHAPPNNLALHEPSAVPRMPRSGQLARLTVLLTNHSDQPQATTVQMRINGRPADAQSLTVDPRQTREVAFDSMLDQADEYRVEFELPSDSLPADDRCYLMVHTTDRPQVVVVTDDDIDLPETAGYFIVRSLAPRGDDLDNYEVIRVRSGQTSWPTLTIVAAVFVGDVGRMPEARTSELHRYMVHGGGVAYFCGDGPVAANLTALDQLKPDGVLPWMPTSQRDLTSRIEPVTISGGDWRSPLLKRFDEAGRHALTQIQIRRAWAGGEVDERAHTLLQYSDKTPALAWRGVGNGRLVLANFSPGATHSDMGKHALFVALMQALADEMQAPNAKRGGGVVGQAVNFNTAVVINPSGPVPVVLHPDSNRPVDAAFSFDDQSSNITIAAPPVPGFYTTQQGETVLSITAINIDTRESDLRRISADDLQSALHTAGVESEIHSESVGSVFNVHGRSLWGWMLFCALTLFGVEMALLGYWRQ